MQYEEVTEPKSVADSMDEICETSACIREGKSQTKKSNKIKT